MMNDSDVTIDLNALTTTHDDDSADDVVNAIIDAVKKWLNKVREELDSLVAAGLEAELWLELTNREVLPAVAARYIAEAAKTVKIRGKGVRQQEQLDLLIGWPDGVEGPETVQEIIDKYPATFAGVDATQVLYVVQSPSWSNRFQHYMNNTRNLVVGMPDRTFVDMQRALGKTGVTAGFEQLKAVREFLSWEAEGGYQGWIVRAERIARTELATARNAAQFDAAEQVAETGERVTKVWLAAHDERTRDAHAAADGQTVDLDEPFDVGGEALMYPGDRENGSAGNVIACRCSVSYVEANLSVNRGREVTNIDDLRKMLEEMEQNMNNISAAGVVDAVRWQGQLAPIGEATGDGRVFDSEGDFAFREFPLPLLWQETTGEGHDSSRVVGTIDTGEVKDGAVVATGTVFASEAKVLELLDAGVIRPSVDLCDMVAEVDDEETMIVSSAKIMAATLVAKPAFERVFINVDSDETSEVDADALVAAAAVIDLPVMQASMFDDPQLDEPTPLTVTSEGRVYGHLALWDSSHVGMPGRKVKPPRSSTGYSAFHQSTVLTDNDDRLAVGRLTVGGGHASSRAGVRAAAEHYDQTGSCWAFVRAGEDDLGIYVAGCVNPDATPAQVRAGASAPLSGDWRRIGSNLELVAALSVSTPGFPIRREFTDVTGDQMSLVAAAQIVDDDEAKSTSVDVDSEFVAKVAADAAVRAVRQHDAKAAADERAAKLAALATRFDSLSASLPSARRDVFNTLSARLDDEEGED